VQVEKVVQERRGDRELEGRDEPPQRARNRRQVEAESRRDGDDRVAVGVRVLRLQPPVAAADEGQDGRGQPRAGDVDGIVLEGPDELLQRAPPPEGGSQRTRAKRLEQGDALQPPMPVLRESAPAWTTSPSSRR
jgi:hypothetical protein